MKHFYILVLMISTSVFAELTPSQQVQYDTQIKSGNVAAVYDLSLDEVPLEQSNANVAKLVEGVLKGYPILKDPALTVNESRRLIREANCKSDYGGSHCYSSGPNPYERYRSIYEDSGCKGKPPRCSGGNGVTSATCDIYSGVWSCKRGG